MRLGPESFRFEWDFPDGRRALMRRAGWDDVDALRALYFTTYGDRYGLPEVVDDERCRHVLTSSDWFWLLTECEGRVIASLIFGLESRHRLGKTFGGVVEAEFRGHKIMQVMLREGLGLLLCEGGPFDLVYAVVRTFVSLNFHLDLSELGFVDVGIFPNVRKVQHYETHGLKVCLGEVAKRDRRRTPELIPELVTLYDITRKRLGFEPARRVTVKRDPPPLERVELVERAEVGKGVDTSRVRFLWKTSRDLEFSFFPLHLPNLILTDPSGVVRVFLCLQERDGHASILGIRFGGYDRAEVLLSVADYCQERGATYLELLVSAYSPEDQALAYRAGFLPCAYFPAAEVDRQGRRADVVITSKTFVPLHFRGLKLPEQTKPYLLEFYKTYTAHLWEELMDA
ncbi:MAG: hypothetical protein AB7S38_20880 [Vulcanimicrobiota bacterium]